MACLPCDGPINLLSWLVLQTHLKLAMKLGVATERFTTLLSRRSSARLWKAHSHTVQSLGLQPSSHPHAAQPFLAAGQRHADSAHHN